MFSNKEIVNLLTEIRDLLKELRPNKPKQEVGKTIKPVWITGKDLDNEDLHKIGE